MFSSISVSVKKFDEIFIKIITEIIPCNYFIEAGAYEGETSRLIQSLLPNANVYAFEANKYNYLHFKDLFKNSKANYLNLAVSDKNDIISFNIQKTKKGKYIDKIKGNNSILLRNEDEVDYENILVQSITLDNYFKNKIKYNDNIALWMDLEGIAYQALEGSFNILKNVYAIKIEVESYQYWKNQKLNTDVTKLLLTHGFFEIMCDFETSNQFNILFCKKNVIENNDFQKLIKNLIK